MTRLTGRRGLKAELKRQHARTARAGQGSVPSRVVGRDTDGTQLVLPQGSTCPQRDAIGSDGLGDVILSPTSQVSATRGIAGAALASVVAGEAAFLERQDPPELERGRSATVVVAGRGFKERIQLDYLREGEEPHPGVAIDEIRVVDEFSAEVDVTVAPDAELVDEAPVAHDLQGLTPEPEAEPEAPADPPTPDAEPPRTHLPKVRRSFYSVIYPQEPPRTLGLWHDGTDLIGRHLSATGEIVGEVGRVAISPSIWRPLRTAIVWHDADDRVPDHTILWADGAGVLHLTDLAGEVDTTYSPGGGWRVAGAFQRGPGLPLFWIEMDPTGSGQTMPWRLVTSLTDLVPQVVATRSLPHGQGGSPTVTWSLEPVAVAFSGGQAALVAEYEISQVKGLATAWIELTGSGSGHQEDGSDQEGRVCLPAVGGAAIRGSARITWGFGGEEGGAPIWETYRPHGASLSQVGVPNDDAQWVAYLSSYSGEDPGDPSLNQIYEVQATAGSPAPDAVIDLVLDDLGLPEALFPLW
ncbi:MAG: hypothetical protein AAGN46_05625 [Acidobacteriota bacterium]